MTMGEVFERLGQVLDVLAFFANNHAHSGGKNVNHDFFSRPFDLDARKPRFEATLPNVGTDLLVFNQKLGGVLVASIPPALPVHENAGAKTSWSYFLPHNPPSFKRQKALDRELCSDPRLECFNRSYSSSPSRMM